MKSIRNKIFTIIFSLALAIFAVASCEVGLGSSVDTEPPTLIINSPESASIIRGNFAIKGSWTDDQEVTEVTCTLKNTDNEELTYSFEGEVYTADSGEGSWTVMIQTASVADGTYEAHVCVVDGADHETVAVRQLVIDNTEPIVVLKRPSSRLGQAAEDIDGYGQFFSLKGLAADDSGVGLIEVSIYSDEALTNLIKTISIKNVPNTISLDVAQFEEGISNVYSEIYGSTSRTAGEKKRWCKVTAYDGAQYYPANGASQSEDDKKGNASTAYYLYEDISKTILSEYKITELYAMKNGSYKGNGRSAGSSVLSSLESNKIEAGVFTLNPANNPYYTVSGYQELKKDGTDFGESMYVTNGNSLIVSVKPGLDSYAVIENTIKVYVQQCNKNAAPIGDRILIDNVTIEKSGTSYTLTVPLSKANGLSTGRNYLLIVEGHDESVSENPLVTRGKGYGFYLDANGSKPSLKVTEPASTATKSINAEESSITLSGTVYFPSETSDGGRILIKDSASGLSWPVSSGTATGIFAVDENKDWHITLNFSNSGGNDSEGKPYLPDGEHNLVVYAYTGTDFNTADSVVSVERNIKLDTQKPDAPKNLKVNGQAFSADKWYNSQNLQVELEVKDPKANGYASGLQKTEYFINNSTTASPLESTTGGYLNGLEDGPNTVKFQSEDKVRNKSEEFKVTIKVDTEAPEITGATIGNASETANLVPGSLVNLKKEQNTNDRKKINLQIKEARELDTVLVKVNGSSLGTIAAVNDDPNDPDSDIWTWESGELTLATDVEIPVNVEITDKAGNKTTENYSIRVDTQGPVITMTLPDPEKSLSGNDSLKKATTLGADISDSAGIAETKYYITSTAFAADNDYEAAKQSAKDDTSNTTWTLSDKKVRVSANSGSTEGFWYFYVYSKDQAQNESIAVRTFWFDKELPDLGIINEPDGIYNGEAADKRISINGSASDANGITELKYTVKNSAGSIVKEENCSTGSWSISLPYGGTRTAPLTDGNYTIEITAKDGAGKTNSESYSVLIDTKKPVISNFAVSNTKKDGWYKDSELNVSVTVTDENNVTQVQYSTDENPSSLLPLTITGNTASDPVSFENSGEVKTISITATDGAGNNNTESFTVKIDSEKPSLSAKFRQTGNEASVPFSGTAYVNGSVPLTLWGDYSDTVSGADGISLQLGENPIAAAITYYDASNNEYSSITDENRKLIRSWKAVIQGNKFTESGILKVNGKDLAGNTGTANETASIVFDRVDPKINKDTISITDNSETTAYRSSTDPIIYYVNNSAGKTFTIKGVSSDDDSGVASTKLTISDGSKTETYTSLKAASWSFDVANLNEFTGSSATATITATDLAGNTKSETIKLNFDTTAPARTGTIKIDNENYTSGMWGIKSALSFNGNVTDSGSGPAKIHFERFASDDLTTTPTSTGTITVSANAFNGNVTGLLEGDNYIRLIAEDNVGNKETGVTELYYVCVDTKAPSLSSSSGGTQFTNGSTPVTVTGKCSDSGSGIDSVTASVTIGSGNSAVTIHASALQIDETTTPREWEATIIVSETDLAGVNDGDEFDIEATAKDVAGHETTLTVARLQVDRVAPSATLNSIVQSVASEGKYLVKPERELTVKGLTEDDLSNTVETWLKLVPYTSTASVSAIEISKATPATNPSWTLSIPADKLSTAGGCIGAKLFVCTKDLAGNINESEKADLKYDAKGPVYKDSVATKVAGKTHASSNYYNSENLIIEGAWEDMAGVSEVTYELTVPASPTPLTGSFSVTGKGNGLYTFNAEIRGFVSGENQLKLKARDTLGNISESSKDFTIKVDTTAPTADEFSDDYSFNKSHLSNGSENKVLYFWADDADSGIDTETAPVITLGKKELTDTDSSAEYASEITEGKGYKVTVTLDKDDFESGYQPIVVTIKDKAGNTSRVNLGSMDIDKDPPEVVLKAPADADIETDETEVNGTITIKGTATDKNLKDAPVSAIEYYDSAASEWKALSTISGALTITKNEGDFEFTLDTTKLSGEYKIRVKANDNGENEGTSNEIEFTVDQETDRPVITFMDIEVPAIEADATSTDPAIIKLVNSKKLRVTVSDDDGIAADGFIINQLTAGTETDLATGKPEIIRTPLSAAASRNGTYVYNLPDTITDGIHDLEFIVIDTETSETANRTFTSGTAKAPKLTDGTHKMNKAKAPVQLMLDSIAPVSSETKYTYYEDTYPATPVWETSVPALGGNRKNLAIKIVAADENKIESVTATIEGALTSGVRQKRIVTVNGQSEEVDDELKADGKYYSNWLITGIDLSETAIENGGNYKLELTIKDCASNTRTDSIQLSIDRTPPVLSIISPKPVDGDNTTYSAGSIKANGSISGASSLRFAVSDSATTAPAASAYSDEIDFSTTWNIDFDGNTSATTGAHAEQLNTYLINFGKTTQAALDRKDNPYSTITPIYLWLKAEDEVGNPNETPFRILVNPQGDRPTIKITNPQVFEQIFGNAVTIYGTHQDTLGTSAEKIGVKSAWVQIISEAQGDNIVDLLAYEDPTLTGSERIYNRVATLTTVSGSKMITAFKMAKVDLDYLAGIKDASGNPVYKIYNMKTYKGDGTDVAYTVGSSIPADSVNDYAILAKINGMSWSLDINSQGEFNPNSHQNSKRNLVAIQVYAKDGDNKLNTVIENKYIFFDSDTPQIIDLTLEQYNSSNELIATRPYQSDMYISFRNNTKWKLTGKAKDDRFVKSLTVNGTAKTVTGNNDTENFECELTKSGSVGTISFKITATDDANHTGENSITIRYDDEAPDLVTSGSDYNIRTIIQQDNGFYKFSSVAKEEPAADGTSQSGFAYTAFYFMRGNKLYNILNAKNSSTLSDNVSAANSGFTYGTQDHLYWYTKTVTSRTSDTNTLTIDSSSDMTGIHKNALVKIEGTYYRINNVSGNTFELDGIPLKDSTTVYVAAAALIDNEAKEKAKDGKTPDETDGYYAANDLELDDGDRMVEYVYKSGTSWEWEANVSSKNIADGPVKLVYVVFDKAGNFEHKSVDAIICNNTPRIAGFSVYTDYNNNGTVDETGIDGKYEAYLASTYSANSVTGIKTVNGVTKNVYDPDAISSVTSQKNPLKNKIVAYKADPDNENARLPVMTLRGKTKIEVEIVGGNDDVFYDYEIKNTPKNKTLSGTGAKKLFTGSTDYTSNSKAIYLQLGDLVALDDIECTEFKFTFRDSMEDRAKLSTTDYSFTDEEKAEVNAYLSVYMGVAAAASNPPVVKINPFYWNSIEDNSIYGTKNSNTTYKDLKGHIELEDDWTNASGYDGTTSGEYDADPKVSGQVVLTGTVHDANLIEDIFITFGSFIKDDDNNIGVTVASFDDTNGTLASTDYTDRYDAKGYKFEINKETFSGDGHDVEWTLYLNTEKVGGSTIAATDVALTVIAHNKGSPDCGSAVNAANGDAEDIIGIAGNKKYGDATYEPSTKKTNNPGSTNTSKTAKTAYYRMDIVPYITDIQTSLSSANKNNHSVYSRTALGHYPVYMSHEQGNTPTAFEQGIKVYGFNLSGGSIALGGTSNNTQTLAAASGYYTFNLPSGARKGAATVTVGTGANAVSSLNNVNNDNSKGDYTYTGTIPAQGDYTKYTNFYNRMPNKANNNKLTDNIYFDIWDFNTQAAMAYGNGQLDNAIMKVSPTSGMLGFAFSNGSERFSMGGTNVEDGVEYSYLQWNRSFDYMQSTSLAYDSKGHTYATAAGGDINKDLKWDALSFMTDRWTQPILGSGQYGNPSVNKESNSIKQIEGIGQNGDAKTPNGTTKSVRKDRFQSLSYATMRNKADNGTYIYLAYYDLLNDEIRFKAGELVDNDIQNPKHGTVGSGLGPAHSDFGNFVKKFEYNETDYSTNAALCQIVATNTTTGNYPQSSTLGSVGNAVAIGVTSDNIVVMVWADGTDLKYSYNNAFAGYLTNTAQDKTFNNRVKEAARVKASSTGWSSAETLIEGAGEYCQLEVATDNSIHVVAYDSTNSALKYAYLSGYNNIATAKVCTVDSYLDTGSQLSLDVAAERINGTVRYIPHIGYWAAYPEKPRYAYLADPATFFSDTDEKGRSGAVSDKFTTVWECGVIPTPSTLKEGKVNVGLWKATVTPTGTTTEVKGYRVASDHTGFKTGTSEAATDKGKCYGNGTDNPVLAYVTTPSSSTYYIETAQMR